MPTLRWLTAGVLICFVGAALRAEEKPNYAKLLVGKWEATKVDEGTLPKGSIVEFTKDGKLKVTVKQEGQEMTIDGTYKVEGDKFTVTVKFGDEEHSNTITITKLEGKVMSTKDKDGKLAEFERK